MSNHKRRTTLDNLALALAETKERGHTLSHALIDSVVTQYTVVQVEHVQQVKNVDESLLAKYIMIEAFKHYTMLLVRDKTLRGMLVSNTVSGEQYRKQLQLSPETDKIDLDNYLTVHRYLPESIADNLGEELGDLDIILAPLIQREDISLETGKSVLHLYIEHTMAAIADSYTYTWERSLRTKE